MELPLYSRRSGTLEQAAPSIGQAELRPGPTELSSAPYRLRPAAPLTDRCRLAQVRNNRVWAARSGAALWLRGGSRQR